MLIATNRFLFFYSFYSSYGNIHTSTHTRMTTTTRGKGRKANEDRWSLLFLSSHMYTRQGQDNKIKTRDEETTRATSKYWKRYTPYCLHRFHTCEWMNNWQQTIRKQTTPSHSSPSYSKISLNEKRYPLTFLGITHTTNTHTYSLQEQMRERDRNSNQLTHSCKRPHSASQSSD